MSTWLTTALGEGGAITDGVKEMLANVNALVPVALGVVVAVIIGTTGISLVKKFLGKGK